MDPNKLFEILGKVTAENFLLKDEMQKLREEIKELEKELLKLKEN